MTNISTNPENALISNLPLRTIVSDENLDAGLLSDKAVIARQFFEAFPARRNVIDLQSADTVETSAISFVDQFRVGKWDLFALLDSSRSDIDIMALFAFLATRIGPDPEQHLFFEGEHGVLARHLQQAG